MAEDIRVTISELDALLQVLDRKFNMYVAGQEKVPPVRDYALFMQGLNKLATAKKTATSVSLRFYITSFQQRFISYRTKWERLLRDIEEGRLQRGKPDRP